MDIIYNLSYYLYKIKTYAIYDIINFSIKSVDIRLMRNNKTIFRTTHNIFINL